MAAEGFYLVQGDKTTCGGRITTGAEDHTLFDKPVAREQDSVTCGKHAGLFKIAGGIDNDTIHDRRMAGTLDSYSTCPCKAKFIPSMMDDTYEKTTSGQSEPEQHAQSANKNNKKSDEKLDYKILLSGNKVLTPLSIPDYDEMIKGGSTNNTEKIGFRIINKGDEAEGLSLEVVDGAELIYSEKYTSSLFEQGEHEWYWDGYSNAGILDTRKLKSKSLTVRLIALRGDQMIKVDLALNNSPKEQDWVDVLINRTSTTVDVFWRVAFDDGGIDGMNQLLQPVSYIDLQKLAKQGIEFYWSRNGTRVPGIGDGIITRQGKYKVSVSVGVNTTASMPSFSLVECLESEYGRSSSLAGFRKICHNYGFYYSRYIQGLEPDYNAAAESRFKLDSAHEMGHILLNKYGAGSSPDYSWSHKKTSTVLTQEPLPGFKMPRQGEIDLMKYSDNPAPALIQYSNSIAANEDVKGLIWLSRVEFND
ncbi:PAAR domain-containing protein [Citrobacter braakii]|uniref:PAAR domain-containing protein n=1 Tax=Citrobacter braakii TaxID=57706 RepID=UPI00295D527A|nr:PAAR domain-containing protein [Citrobacter braakii]MDW2597139.1 PAAR domain-containing protein [Citrobacter braakii]MDW2660850.1 PAAR domain-containing protein [Citrobacter braakii]MDW2708545.1 PAAR domain-containing protein [Citrobacter braakii]HEF0010724.1 PAAR domain-containing protein [Citrobacter braakii]